MCTAQNQWGQTRLKNHKSAHIQWSLTPLIVCFLFVNQANAKGWCMTERDHPIEQESEMIILTKADIWTPDINHVRAEVNNLWDKEIDDLYQKLLLVIDKKEQSLLTMNQKAWSDFIKSEERWAWNHRFPVDYVGTGSTGEIIQHLIDVKSQRSCHLFNIYQQYVDNEINTSMRFSEKFIVDFFNTADGNEETISIGNEIKLQQTANTDLLLKLMKSGNYDEKLEYVNKKQQEMHRNYQ